MIAAIAPPRTVFGHTATIERAPAQRPNADALLLCALFNAFPFDWLVRLKAGTHLSLYLLQDLPVPRFAEPAARLLAHVALLLSCHHAGYAPLWREQTGQRWRDPPLPDARARWQLRAAADAVVADAYGLTRPLYEHVLRGFSHKSFTDAPALCLGAFDLLQIQGVAAFCREHDPLANIPLPSDPAGPVRIFSDAGAALSLARRLPITEPHGAHRDPSSPRQGGSRTARAGSAV
jgi:hypothetical protein